MSLVNIPQPRPLASKHVQSIMDEGDGVSKQMARMNAFKNSPGFATLAPLDAHLFVLQLEAMQTYLHILTIRLARANDAATSIKLDTSRTLDKTTTGKLDVN